ncbi:MAG: hypothetical protein R3F60_29205 [bacterium]
MSPAGRRIFSIGACVWRWDGEPVEDAAVDLAIEEAVMAPLPPACAYDAEGLRLGSIRDDQEYPTLQGFSDDGQRWSIAMVVPGPVRVPVGGHFRIEIQRYPFSFFNQSGSVAVVDDLGLLAWMAAGDGGFSGYEGHGLSVQRAEQDCYYEEPDEFQCTYTGFQVQAASAGEARILRFGQFGEVGDLTVFHGGLMAIGDRGACNAGPETFELGAVGP